MFSFLHLITIFTSMDFIIILWSHSWLYSFLATLDQRLSIFCFLVLGDVWSLQVSGLCNPEILVLWPHLGRPDRKITLDKYARWTACKISETNMSNTAKNTWVFFYHGDGNSKYLTDLTLVLGSATEDLDIKKFLLFSSHYGKSFVWSL